MPCAGTLRREGGRLPNSSTTARAARSNGGRPSTRSSRPPDPASWPRSEIIRSLRDEEHGLGPVNRHVESRPPSTPIGGDGIRGPHIALPLVSRPSGGPVLCWNFGTGLAVVVATKLDRLARSLHQLVT